MAKWLSRGVSPVVQAMVRGSLPAAEQQELVRQLCASVAPHLPDFAITGMVLELLQVDLQAGERFLRSINPVGPHVMHVLMCWGGARGSHCCSARRCPCAVWLPPAPVCALQAPTGRRRWRA